MLRIPVAAPRGATWFALLTLVSGTISCSDETTNPPTDSGKYVHWEPLLPQMSHLTDVEIGADQSIVALEANGSVSRYDGSTWHLLPPSGMDGARAVWALTNGHVLVGGDGPGLRQWNGQTWETLSLGGFSFYDISGSTDVTIAVGFHGRTFEFDSSEWREVATPTTATLHALDGEITGRFFAAGESGTLLERVGPGHWELVEGVSTRNDLTDVAMSRLGVFATRGEEVILIPDDGGEEIIYPFPGHPRSIDWRDDVLWVTAEEGVFSTDTEGTLEWTELQIEGRSLAFTGSQVVAGSGQVVIGTRSGVAYERLQPEPAWTRHQTGVGGSSFGAITGNGDHDLWVFSEETASFHWDGAAWLPLQIPGARFAANDGKDTYFITGEGELCRLVGSGYEVEARIPSGREATALWAGGGDVVIVGEDGLLFHRQDGVWRESYLGVPDDNHFLLDVDGTASDNIVAVAEDRVYHFDGREWSEVFGTPPRTENARYRWVEVTFSNAYLAGNAVWRLSPSRDGWVPSYLPSGSLGLLKAFCINAEGRPVIISGFGSSFRVQEFVDRRWIGDPTRDLRATDGLAAWASPSGRIFIAADNVWGSVE